ncbi:MAG: AMP-binding protein, partial [Cyanobium sp.]
PPAVLERLEAVFQVPVLEAYGMTEAAHQICSIRLPGSMLDRIPGSVGPSAGPEVAVLGPSHEHLPAGEAGEVAIRGSSVTSGYEAADQSGWVKAATGERFLTGDEGLFDAQGRLTLTGRFKEMNNRGGEKVIPRRVDEALLQHPEVEQALPFAVPHPRSGPGGSSGDAPRHDCGSACLSYASCTRLTSVALKLLPLNSSGASRARASPPLGAPLRCPSP